MDSAGDPLIGTYIGNFLIETRLGEGAMGAVYLGKHYTLGRRVAIKVIHPHLARDPSLLDRFIDEARAVSGIGHPGLVEVFDFGVTETGEHYSIMEFLDGTDLEHVINAEGTLDPTRVATLGAEIADAVAAAHDRGIVHRDLKPENIFLIHDTHGVERVKVVDFGIAKLLGGESRSGVNRTMAGTLIGTPMYIAPEQALGLPDIDGRADIYSLGVALYHALAGRIPFSYTAPYELVRAHIDEEPTPLLEVAPKVPQMLAAVVMCCLKKDRKARFRNMLELRDALVSAREGTTSASATLTQARAVGAAIATTVYAAPSSRSKRVLAIAAGALVVAIVVATAALTRKGGEAPAALVADAGSAPAVAASVDAAAAAGSTADGASGPAQNPYRADDTSVLAAGAAVWRSKCAGCHGARGGGDGKETPSGLEPKSFSDARAMPGLLDIYRFEIVRRGIEHKGRFTMPAFGGQLSVDDTWKVVTFVGTLAQPAAEAKPLTRAQMPKNPKPALDEAAAARGAELYRRKCASCHGRRGKGDGPASQYLGRFPADLTRGEYKLRSTSRGQLPTDEDLYMTLNNGMGVGGMPAFSRLPETDLWSLVAYLKTMCPRFAKPPQGAPELVEIPPRPAPTEQARERGRDSFVTAGCPKCHGATGKGDGPKAESLRDSRGHPVRPPNLGAPFLFIGGASAEQIYRTMMTGIDGTPMPQGSIFFEPKDAWDVVEFILSLSPSR